MRRVISVALVAILIGACSSDRSSLSGTTTVPVGSTVPTTAGPTTSSPTTTTPTTAIPATSIPATPTSTTASPTTTPATAGPTTASPTTTPATAGPTTTAGETCAPVGNTARKTSSDPLLMTGAIGVDIRTGRHLCFERVVIEAANGAFPGWTAEYVDDPVRLGESDQFTFIQGAATLQVRISMWMPTMEGDGYPGPIRVLPTDVDHILEMHETENFEGMCIWSIGLDAEYPFIVSLLHNPERMVIDFQIPFGS